MGDGVVSGKRASAAKPISSIDDSGTERLAVDAKLTTGSVLEANLDYTDDEVTTANSSDGGTTRAITAGDTSGRTIVVGAAADAAAVAGAPVLVAGKEQASGLARTLRVDDDGELIVHQKSASVALADTVSNTTNIIVTQDESAFIGQATLPFMFNGTTWDRVRGAAADGLTVNLGTNNDVTVTSGSVTADTELPAAAVLADNTANPTVPGVSAFGMAYDGSTWDRMRGTSTDGLLVNLGANNDVTINSGSVTADTELPAAAALADNTANPTVPGVGSFGHVWDGATWDRTPGNATDGVTVNLGANNDVTLSGTLTVQGSVAHDGADSGNPVKVGGRAVAHGATPTEVAAADRTDLLTNRQGVPFVMGGVPNVKTFEYRWTTAQTNDAVVSVSAGTKIVVTSLMVTVDEAATVGVKVRVGFGTASVPTEAADGAGIAGVFFSHGGLVPGGGATRGDGSGILGIGADDEDVRITAGAPTSGEAHLVLTYYEVAS